MKLWSQSLTSRGRSLSLSSSSRLRFSWVYLYCASSLPLSSLATPQEPTIAFCCTPQHQRRPPSNRIGFLPQQQQQQQHPHKSLRKMASTSTSSCSGKKQVVVDPFCFRQFSEYKEASQNYKGTIFTDLTVEKMEDIVNRHYDPSNLQDGYAPFCKHLFIKNDGYSQSARVNVLPITPDNQHLLRSEYQARNDKELPVLVRYFPSELLQDQQIDLPVATYLDIILYSREQIQKENQAMGNNNKNNNKNNNNSPSEEQEEETAPWGIVSIKAQLDPFELPMTPITAMRNALGESEGGSGVPLNREEYIKAVEYWSKHATVS